MHGKKEKFERIFNRVLILLSRYTKRPVIHYFTVILVLQTPRIASKRVINRKKGVFIVPKPKFALIQRFSKCLG